MSDEQYLRQMPYLSVWSFALWRNEITRIDPQDPMITVSSAMPDFEHFNTPIPLGIPVEWWPDAPEAPEGILQPLYLTVARSHASIGDAVETLTRLNDEGFWGVSSLHGDITKPLATWVGHPVWAGQPNWDNINLPAWVTRSLMRHLEEDARTWMAHGLYDDWKIRTPFPLISALEWCDLLDENHLPFVVSSPAPTPNCWLNPDTREEDSPVLIPSFVPDAWNSGRGWKAVPFVRRSGVPVEDSGFNPFGLVPLGEGPFLHDLPSLILTPSSLAMAEGRKACFEHVSHALTNASMLSPRLILADTLVAGISHSSVPFTLYNLVDQQPSGDPRIYESLDRVHKTLLLMFGPAHQVTSFLTQADHLPTCNLRDVLSGSNECSCGIDRIRTSAKNLNASLDQLMTAIRPHIVPF